MLFRIDFEIGIYPDRIQVSDRRSGRFVDFAAEISFSSPQRLIADPVYFENALAKAMRKAMSGGFILFDAQARVGAGAKRCLPPTTRPFAARCATSASRQSGLKVARATSERPRSPLASRRFSEALPGRRTLLG